MYLMMTGTLGLFLYPPLPTYANEVLNVRIQ